MLDSVGERGLCLLDALAALECSGTATATRLRGRVWSRFACPADGEDARMFEWWFRIRFWKRVVA
ncbi:MAG TPA: hypothetical protein PLU13_10195, partial [Thermomonas sp.]|nr:hypothetical protein [Thermomonas sp.]